MESKFYIGQRVVANRNHSKLFFIKDGIYTVLGIYKSCHGFTIKILTGYEHMTMECAVCKKKHENKAGYFAQEAFDPIEEQQISNFTFEEAIELVTEKENVELI